MRQPSRRLPRALRRSLVVAGAAGALLVATPIAASAHPLGNFSINHYTGVTLHPDRVDVHAVVDTAEIPTSQQRGRIDIDGDGALSAAEAAAWASTSCAELRSSLSVATGGTDVPLQVRQSRFAFRPGAAGLQTGRLECELTGALRLSGSTTVDIRDGSPAARVGWHEITVVGDGVALQDSPVPSTSVSDELRRYPNDLLASPLDVRSASVHVVPGAGASTYGTFVTAPKAGFLGRTVGAVDRKFNALVGGPASVGSIALAALLALVLGAAHAALPGHGKTIMAAYLAGRRGSVKDAVTVGATVTITHTVGVLALGLALSLSSALAGDVVTRRLALVSGGIVVLVGVGLLRSALRGGHGHSHGPGGHSHGPGGHSHDHEHHEHEHHADGHAHPHDHHEHEHPHELDPPHAVPAGSVALQTRPAPVLVTETPVAPAPRRFSRAGLVGMGIAGGLVPSPSALVVLLSAIALGRAWLGIVLVLLYGLGMAGTLTTIGLLLVKAGDRVQRRFLSPSPRVARLQRLIPVLTAVVVIGVGGLLTVRAL